MGTIREILGKKTLTLVNVCLISLGESFQPTLIVVVPPGTLLACGVMGAAKKWMVDRSKAK